MSLRAWVLLATCSACWGLPYLLIKVLVDDGVPVGVIAFTRVAIGALVLLPFAWRDLRPLWERRGAVVVLALLDMAVPFLLITQGERAIASSLAGILVASVPLLIALIALRWDHTERVDAGRSVGLVIGMAGVVALLGLEVSGDTRALAGATLVLAASLCYAAATLYVKRAFAGVPAVPLVAATLAASAVLLAPVAAVQAPGSGVPGGGSIAALVALGAVCSALAYGTYYALIALVGAGRAALNTYLSPAIAAVAGALILDESLGAAAIGGLLLILAGAWLAGGGGPPWRKGSTTATRAIRPMRGAPAQSIIEECS
jgi:drug/metabolite transporter (DMT)-like permease